jgi:hypothetical protein
VPALFTPGKSGNPRGRPKGSRNLTAALRKVYTDNITVREGDKKRRLPRLEALARKQVDLAFKGDQRALQTAFSTAKALGLLSTDQASHRSIVEAWDNLAVLTDEELADLERIFSKMCATKSQE